MIHVHHLAALGTGFMAHATMGIMQKNATMDGYQSQRDYF